MKSLLEQHDGLSLQKLGIDARIQAISLELAKASHQYHETGKGMAKDRYFKLKTELTRLKPESQRLQMELGKLKSQIRKGERKTLGEHFITVAKLQLTTDQFEKLLRLAIELRDGEQ